METVGFSDRNRRQERGEELTTFRAVHSRFVAIRDHCDHVGLVTENE
ncbi:hypothetical protein BAP_4043 [Bacillus sp. CN2]|nr:hypothetical protein BAP_4043 [Bacillus sp. CN2]